MEELIGKTLSRIERIEDGYDSNETLLFFTEDDEIYGMYHSQDCCESVHIEDIVGELDDLIGSPIVKAYGSSDGGEDEDGWGSHTWTFYHLATAKGYVTIRWYGSSNGYYSESASFSKFKKNEDGWGGFTFEDDKYRIDW